MDINNIEGRHAAEQQAEHVKQQKKLKMDQDDREFIGLLKQVKTKRIKEMYNIP